MDSNCLPSPVHDLNRLVGDRLRNEIGIHQIRLYGLDLRLTQIELALQLVLQLEQLLQLLELLGGQLQLLLAARLARDRHRLAVLERVEFDEDLLVELQLGQRVRLVLLARRGVDAVDQGVRVGAGCHCCWGWCCGARLGQRWVIAIWEKMQLPNILPIIFV